MAKTAFLRRRASVAAPSGVTIVNAFENSSNGSAFNVSISGAQSGDVIVAVQSNSDTGAIPSGYTSFLDGAILGSAHLTASYKVLSGADSSVAFPAGYLSGSYGTAGGCLLLRSVNATPIDATATKVEAQNGGQPDSPSITTVTNGALVISIFGGLIDSLDATYTEPSGYTKQVDILGDSTYDFGLGIATKTVTSAGAEDPGAWSGVTLLSASQYWGAASLAIRPA